MISFSARRRANLAVTVVLLALSWLVLAVLDVVLYDTAFLSGWTLAGLLVLLSAFNTRKKLPFLALGTGASWLQFHIYAGIFSAVLFCYHVEFRIPNGALEITLAVLFMIVSASGVVGLVLTRTLPPRLTTRGETVLFDRIPALIAELRQETEDLVVQSVEETNTTTVANFYMERLAWFFRGPRHGISHFLLSDRPRRALLEEVVALERYGTSREIEFLEMLSKRIELKSDLDFRYALQAVLKGWLFVHIPATYSLLLLAVVHVIVVHAFDGTL